MTYPPPAAWIGFAIERNQAKVKLCPQCAGYETAKVEARPLPTVDIPCHYHYQLEQERRHP